MRYFNIGSLFARLFSLGLALMVLDIVKESIYFIHHSNFVVLNIISLSAIGLIICLISFPFLMVEWLVSPLGTQAKRIKFYQGAGNLLALAMLVGGWIWRGDSSRHYTEAASFAISSGGLITALIFGWTGQQIAGFISKKRIQLESFGNAARTQMRNPLVENNSLLEPKMSQNNLTNRISVNPLTHLTQN